MAAASRAPVGGAALFADSARAHRKSGKPFCRLIDSKSRIFVGQTAKLRTAVVVVFVVTMAAPQHTARRRRPFLCDSRAFASAMTQSESRNQPRRRTRSQLKFLPLMPLRLGLKRNGTVRRYATYSTRRLPTYEPTRQRPFAILSGVQVLRPIGLNLFLFHIF